MKTVLLVVSVVMCSVSFAKKAEKGETRAPAREGKATICYDEAMKYAADLASDGKAQVRKGKLEMFTNIGEVQVEGWSFSTSLGKTIVVVASADGSAPEQCRVELLYNK